MTSTHTLIRQSTCRFLAVAFVVAFGAQTPLWAQDTLAGEDTPPEQIDLAAPELANDEVIAKDRDQVDELITQRLSAIYAEVDGLDRIKVTAQSGVVTLNGAVANGETASEAIALAQRLEGVILVRDNIERLRDLESNLSPAVEGLSQNLDAAIAGLPLVGVAFALFLIIAFGGHLIARWKSLWRTILPNVFLAELVSQAVRVAAIIIGLVVALNLLGANALMGTILGGAGVVGIAIGFAVRDTLENYVASIMLSLRQPFRSNDHVVIGTHEGIVMRLTSRATILMTLDGNHLRIPNADVFKGVILNYTRNPHRRFDFLLGVDAEDDPVSGIETGVGALKELPFLLDERPPFAAIEEVGDSSIILRFHGWIDQNEADFLKARSAAIRAAMEALEANGFTLPEPIYRLRFDQSAVPSLPDTGQKASSEAQTAQSRTRRSRDRTNVDTVSDVRPDQSVNAALEQERSQMAEDDLLDETRPVE